MNNPALAAALQRAAALYLARFDTKLTQLDALADRLDTRPEDPVVVADLIRYWHGLKGSGGSYGFAELTRLGAELEAAARDGARAGRPPTGPLVRDWAARLRRLVDELAPQTPE